MSAAAAPLAISGCAGDLSAKRLVACVLALHPDLQIADATIEAQKPQIAAAGSWQNPTLSSEVVFGNEYGVRSVATSTSLAQSFEFSKIAARRDRAEADQRQLVARALSERESIVLKTVVALYTLKHWDSQLAVIDEAIATFDKIFLLFRSRGRLSPENSVNATVIDLARQDYRLKRGALEAEIDESVRSLEFLAQVKITNFKAILPTVPKPWPAIGTGEAKNGTLAIAQAALQTATAELSMARAESYPTIALGPMFETETKGTEHFSSAGITLSLPLPIWNLNRAGLSFAVQQKQIAAMALQATQARLEVERRNYLIHYNQAIDSLTKASPFESIDRNHRATEALFTRGVVSPTLVIETHRQILEITESYQGHELSAIEALGNLYLIDDNGLSGELL